MMPKLVCHLLRKKAMNGFGSEEQPACMKLWEQVKVLEESKDLLEVQVAQLTDQLRLREKDIADLKKDNLALQSKLSLPWWMRIF